MLRRLGDRLRPLPRACGLELYATTERWYLVRAEPGPQAFVAPALPFRSSTSTSSQLARAVVNLVCRPGEQALDPVCGTGVLLVEAARIGAIVRGGDTNPKAVAAARQNLETVGVRDAAVREADALAEPTGPPADALVADLPYGRRLVEHDLEPFAAALPRLARRWALVSHVDLEPALRAAGHPPRLRIAVPKPTFTRWVFVGP